MPDKISGKWPAYNELAWTDLIVSSPNDCVEETGLYIESIKEHATIEVKTLLHLGCGAGINDYTFKDHFKVTGVDISHGMLNIARSLNPEVTYIHGDMRSIRLDERFDAVTIPDSIDYMQTLDQLREAIETAGEHLKPSGVLLIVANTAERFRENNFVYTGSKDDIDITIFENNYVPDKNGSTYEATLVYLIRRSGDLEIYNDHHVLGLFPVDQWLSLLHEYGFEVTQRHLDHLYDDYIMGEGEHRETMFICRKRL